MPFPDGAVDSGFLQIPFIRSPNYVAGSAGWTINQDGTAEFNATTIRGSLLVTDPDGSFIHIYDQSPGNGAVIDVRPADTVAGVLTPGQVAAFLNGSNRPYLSLRSPQLNSAGFAEVQLSADELGNQFVEVTGPAGITLDGPVTLFAGTSDLDAQSNTIKIGVTGQFDMANDTPAAGVVQTTHGRGIVACYVYTGGTGATSAGAVEAALPAWSSSDQCRFKNGHVYSLECTVGVFSTVAAAAEVTAVRIRSAVNSTVAQQLADAQFPAPAGTNVCSYTFTRYVKNVSGADIDKAALGITVNRAAGTGNHSIFGNAVGTNWAIVIRVKDEGQPTDSNITNAAVAIT
jgi:hypothetical protein